MDVTALRPGVVVGRYPQRQAVDRTVLEQFVAKLGGISRQLVRSRARKDHSLLQRIEAQASSLGAFSDEQLLSHCVQLRKSIVLKGLTRDVAAEVFALVREAAGRKLGLRHHDVQLLGGWALLFGQVAEMATGEGKTLTAALPACAAGLAGVPVHIVSVNDYLVERDAAVLRPLYEFLGLSVGVVRGGMSHEERQRAYACDITYCTNKQLAFDYLRDRLIFGQEMSTLRFRLEELYTESPRSGQLLLRGLCYAIVDEADSVFVDEARTPLILSRKTDAGEEARVYIEALKLARALAQGDDYAVEQDYRDVRITEQGSDNLTALCRTLPGIWQGKRRREQLVRQALVALNFFQRDVHYLVSDGKVLIIDEYTGRVMPDRSWEQGLHQLIEAKEECEITSSPETIARISYQKFFRRYLHLAGMTGTGAEVEGELWSVYGLNVRRIPTHKPSRRYRLRSRLFATETEKWQAVAARAVELRSIGRAALIGTRSVEASRKLSACLNEKGIPHQVLNAAQDGAEADIIAAAGEPGRITVATNMAGRGTDIALHELVEQNGGLHVIATERHHAGRIDRQLFGRCARQGDPGTAEFMLSWDDELLAEYYPAFVRRFMPGRRPGAPLSGSLVDLIALLPQRSAERRHARMRRDLLKLDEQLSRTLAFGGRPE